MKTILAALALTASANVATAGPFLVANYGNTYAKDWQDLVTRDFTARFTPEAWEIFVYSDAVILPRSTQAVCTAIVGVVPKDSHQFPARQFVTTRTATVKPGKWNEDVALDFETECVRSAIGNMMRVPPANAYRPHDQQR
ncbi:hypothetical protein [Ralstonia mannitolilytica]|uniref:hypothetical protein n=1 Tax=Ralstonia mannitolilytica TaxID=105219 RepID=UPI0028F5093C|nr:hypothetical protein [Ralstonia mannitolilytica]CAJ0733976.1 hypothetical protein R76696_00556 [Ralstonia mannitolilytica]